MVVRLRERDAQAVVDTKGPILAYALTHHPFLIKPNCYELEVLCGRKLSSLCNVIYAVSVENKSVAKPLTIYREG